MEKQKKEEMEKDFSLVSYLIYIKVRDMQA
jgi:hypothetical protein